MPITNVDRAASALQAIKASVADMERNSDDGSAYCAGVRDMAATIRHIIERECGQEDAEINDGTWCFAEHCRYRHWRSGSMPTHQRGEHCPERRQLRVPDA